MSFVYNPKTMFIRFVRRRGKVTGPRNQVGDKKTIVDYSNNEETEMARKLPIEMKICKHVAVKVDQVLIALVELDFHCPTESLWGRFEVNGYTIMAEWVPLTHAQFFTYRGMKLAPVVKGIVQELAHKSGDHCVVFGKLDMPIASPEFKEVVKAISPDSRKVHAIRQLESQALEPIEPPEPPEPVAPVAPVAPPHPQ